jgi:DNA-binding transcriptional ArsR family regulator
MEDVPLEAILHALSDPVRAAIFAQIASATCPQTCSAFLQVEDRAIAKSSLSQHFKVLREAGLIHSERRGVEMHNTARCIEVEARFPGLLPAILNAQAAQARGRLAGVGVTLQGAPSSPPDPGTGTRTDSLPGPRDLA